MLLIMLMQFEEYEIYYVYAKKGHAGVVSIPHIDLLQSDSAVAIGNKKGLQLAI